VKPAARGNPTKSSASRTRIGAVGAVLLAAGTAARMGGRPKALLELDGVPLVLRQLKALAGAGVDPRVIVLGSHAERILPLVESLAVTLVRNPRPEDGQIASQRLGLAALKGVDAVMVALADQPLITERHIASLIAAFRARPRGKSVVVPRTAGEPGNPVIFTAAVCAEILEGDPSFGCREWRQRHPAAVMHFDSASRAYVVDVDTPEDIERFEHETSRALRWPRDDSAC
jgi:molybdenum cofactor cytidylyltransferase